MLDQSAASCQYVLAVEGGYLRNFLIFPPQDFRVPVFSVGTNRKMIGLGPYTRKSLILWNTSQVRTHEIVRQASTPAQDVEGAVQNFSCRLDDLLALDLIHPTMIGER